MATIKSGDGTTQLSVDAVSKAARVSIYDPATGMPMGSYIRGAGIDLDTSANSDIRDAIAIAVPGAGGAQVAGTVTTPLRIDPTGTTTQPVSGAVEISNFPDTQPVSGTVTVANPVNSVQVNNFPVTQQVSGAMAVTNFPGTQTVAGSVNVTNLPTTQTVTGTVNANVRVGGSDISAANPLTTVTTGSVTIANTATTAVPVSVITPDYGLSYSAVMEIQPTTLADSTTYWAMRNNGSKVAYIRRIDLEQGFAGTAANSRSTFYLVRFTGAVTGGGAVTPVKKASQGNAAGCSILVANAGLGTTSASFEAGQIHRIANVNQVYSVTTQSLQFGSTEAQCLQLQPGEGLAIRASGTIVAGSFIVGSVGWHEN